MQNPQTEQILTKEKVINLVVKRAYVAKNFKLAQKVIIIILIVVVVVNVVIIVIVLLLLLLLLF